MAGSGSSLAVWGYLTLIIYSSEIHEKLKMGLSCLVELKVMGLSCVIEVKVMVVAVQQLLADAPICRSRPVSILLHVSSIVLCCYVAVLCFSCKKRLKCFSFFFVYRIQELFQQIFG